jgi:adenosylcobinamide-phosphate synthase
MDFPVVLLAYFIDLLLGEPAYLPHPVVFIGRCIKRLEDLLRRSFQNLKLAGLLLLIFIAGGTFVVVEIVTILTFKIDAVLGYLVSVFLIFTTISIRGLSESAKKVCNALRKEDINEARAHLRSLVGRDVERLDKQGVIRATIESVAENTVDGVISPLLYAFLMGGPSLAYMYKAINTLDSMIGYRTERYREFGYASAKLDDLANYIPSRLTGILMPFSAWILRRRFTHTWHVMLKDGRKHPSPNAGIAEAAMAGALGVRLGGVSFYGGQKTIRPIIGGDEGETPTLHHIEDAIKIMHLTTLLMLLLLLIIWLEVRLIR